jgi:hypothetical protein
LIQSSQEENIEKTNTNYRKERERERKQTKMTDGYNEYARSGGGGGGGGGVGSSNSKRGLLASLWSLMTILTAISFLSAFIFALSTKNYTDGDDANNQYYNNYYNNNNNNNNDKDGSQDEQDGENNNSYYYDYPEVAVTSRALAFSALWTGVLAALLSVFGTVILGWQSPTGLYYTCCSSSVHRTTPLGIGSFIGALLMFANLTLVCSVLFGEFEVSVCCRNYSIFNIQYSILYYNHKLATNEYLVYYYIILYYTILFYFSFPFFFFFFFKTTKLHTKRFEIVKGMIMVVVMAVMAIMQIIINITDKEKINQWHFHTCVWY